MKDKPLTIRERELLLSEAQVMVKLAMNLMPGRYFAIGRHLEAARENLEKLLQDMKWVKNAKSSAACLPAAGGWIWAWSGPD